MCPGKCRFDNRGAIGTSSQCEHARMCASRLDPIRAFNLGSCASRRQHRDAATHCSGIQTRSLGLSLSLDSSSFELASARCFRVLYETDRILFIAMDSTKQH